MASKAAYWTNATIYTPAGIVEQGTLVVDDAGTIAAIGGPELAADPAIARHDAGGRLLLPGFIDVHIHGGGGCNVMSGTYAELDGVSRFHAAHGTTAFLATTTTAPLAEIEQALRASADAMNQGVTGAGLIGIHLEGPYLSERRRGAQSKADLRIPTEAEIKRLIDAAAGQIRIATVAPEIDGGMAAVRQFAAGGITVSAGHSDATFEQMRDAVGAGISHTTHHFNGMSPLHHREPGVAGAGLLLSELTTELICDGIHVHPAAVKLLFETKGAMNVCLITDAVTCAGLPDGDYGGVTMHEGQIYLKDGSSLAGSALTTIQALRNAIRFTGYSLERLLPSITEVPARQAGVSDRKGSLETGKDADFVLVDRELDLYETIVGGRSVYARQSHEA
ncbi:N-acetylglucosamine-6-phosphate deacetylase [Paenibacillus lycopersici]|uniref:N-acetylglucosamine-6-phosphate deacetylase n=1 Tax=Paenibacillus lycopersici TaxID=2704462 RepID=A0A6C0G3Y5_9BACL|nr:N-acetylglucosamine-6-phosphate deacetylase [Paenibacillus lycopersici]QHT61430.1 N-acetylglucosamine-6-phosphate deacetylase [Paenibacillus lycopersici]